MRDALHPTAGVASLVWSAPSLLLSVAAACALSWSVDVRLGRARRLLDAGRRDEALSARQLDVVERLMSKHGEGRAWA